MGRISDVCVFFACNDRMMMYYEGIRIGDAEMARDTFINGETAPTGKRTVRRRGDNLIGYIGRTPWECITGRDIDVHSDVAKKASAMWIEGREDWDVACWL